MEFLELELVTELSDKSISASTAPHHRVRSWILELITDLSDKSISASAVPHHSVRSWISGICPQVYKAAILKPLIKKSNLDHNDLKNFRPMSNLSFVSKIIEKVVLSQLSSHLSTNQLFNPFQSAYRPGHSTETAVLKVMNDLLCSLDHGNISVLTLLDL